mgnify:CR=1 FL=1
MAEETRGRGEFGRGGYQKREPQWRERQSDRGDRGDRGGFQRRDDRRGGYQQRDDRRGGFRDDRRDGDRRDFQRRDNDRRDFGGRDDRRGDRGGFQRRDDRRGGHQRRDDRRGGFRDDRRKDASYKNYSSTDEYVSPNGNEPTIPAGVSADELDRDALRALATLSGPNRDIVARHLVMAGQLIDLDPEAAYQHAQAAVSRAGRVDVVREAAALTAYASGRYEEALREVRAVRRMRGDSSLRAVEADAERGLGHPEKAVEIIRVKGLKGIAKREGRSASAGLVVAKVIDSAEGQVGVLVEINSETDFVAKSDPFIAFGQNVLEAAIAADASTLEELKAATYEGKTVEELTTDAGALLGEKIVVRRIARVEGENVAVYLHKTSKDLPAQVGVLLAVSGENTDEIAHDVAVHIAAMSPKYLDSESIPADQVETEKRVARETAIAEGKPEKILDKIVEGRLKGFFKENTLLDQDFAKDSKKSVAQVLSEAGATATAFARFRVGA